MNKSITHILALVSSEDVILFKLLRLLGITVIVVNGNEMVENIIHTLVLKYINSNFLIFSNNLRVWFNMQYGNNIVVSDSLYGGSFWNKDKFLIEFNFPVGLVLLFNCTFSNFLSFEQSGRSIISYYSNLDFKFKFVEEEDFPAWIDKEGLEGSFNVFVTNKIMILTVIKYTIFLRDQIYSKDDLIKFDFYITNLEAISCNLFATSLFYSKDNGFKALGFILEGFFSDKVHSGINKSYPSYLNDIKLNLLNFEVRNKEKWGLEFFRCTVRESEGLNEFSSFTSFCNFFVRSNKK